MPTTDSGAALAALRALQRAKVDFALIHGRTRLLGGTSSTDLDIVVGDEPREVLRLARPELMAEDLRLVALWPYDIGGTATAFLTDSAARASVQLDLLYDEEGLGRYAIRSDVLLRAANRDGQPPCVRAIDGSIYLWSKRRLKGQQNQLLEIQESLQSIPKAILTPSVENLVSTADLAADILGYVPTGLVERQPAKRLRSHAIRIVRRLAQPVGFWVHCPGPRESLAVDLGTRFGAFLVRHAVARHPTSSVRVWAWYWRAIQPTRLRAGFVASWGHDTFAAGPQPDVILDGGVDLGAATSLVVRAMAARFDT